ncbi:MAG: cytochrome c [Fibrobacteria bacterium]|nr:cytochrome c [Fibrobacteria bacterium]
MKLLLQVGGIMALALLYYAYLGNYVPQKEVLPPEELKITADMTADEMAEAGAELYKGKGACGGCHTIGQSGSVLRFPDLGTIGSLAGTRIPGKNDVEYLSESMYEPNKFIVTGFNAGMTPTHKAPFNFSDEEILAVVAYLQGLGGTPNVTLATKTSYYSGASVDAAAGEAVTQDESATPETVSETVLFDKFKCTLCHSLSDDKKVVGPSLQKVGKRLSSAKLYESIMNPNAVIKKSYPKGVMADTLAASHFYTTITVNELKTMVDYLSSSKGGKK